MGLGIFLSLVGKLPSVKVGRRRSMASKTAYVRIFGVYISFLRPDPEPRDMS